MRITDFDIYRDLLKEKSGLSLTPDKSYLLESRLSPIAKKWGYTSMESMTLALQGVPDRHLVSDVVEAMTTNDTSFFRDGAPFDTLRDTILPWLVKKRAAQKKIRIWCAAAASGQEPYSVAITIKEKGLPPGWKTEILATDISSDAMEQARNGHYSQFEVQRGLGVHILLKYFEQDGTKWKIGDDLRKMVRFEQFNLLDSMKKLGMFDVILCRNVLSLFDDPVKKSVLEKLAGQLEKDGFLLLGKSESAAGFSDVLKPLPGTPGLHAFHDSLHHA
jgi:chemotaxis protein methyltransferase CheR